MWLGVRSIGCCNLSCGGNSGGSEVGNSVGNSVNAVSLTRSANFVSVSFAVCVCVSFSSTFLNMHMNVCVSCVFICLLNSIADTIEMGDSSCV